MHIDEYPNNQRNNANQNKPGSKPRPKPNPTLKKPPEVHTKSFGRRVYESFFNFSDIGNFGENLVFRVLIPGVKRTIVETIESFFGVRGIYSNSRYYDEGVPFGTNRREYNNVTRMDNRRRSMSVYDFDEMEFENPLEAQDFFNDVNEYVDEYGILSLNDYYDFARKPPKSPQDTKYGWTDLSKARMEQTFDGTWIIKMPRPIPLD